VPDPAARSYFIRTFGCQMNEHDSERLAGVLEADGLVAAAGVADADVVVLNTCCIRENADNRLYGTLGHLKAEKDRRPGMQIAVGGCLAQKDGEVVRQRAPWVDAVWGTHNISRAADLLSASAVAPVTEILSADVGDDLAFASALPVRRDQAWAAWVTIQVGCDNACAFCIVPSVRGPEASRPFAAVVDEVRLLAAAGTREVTLLGQNVNSYGRDLTTALRRRNDWRDASRAGAAWAGAPTPRARPLFADLLRAVATVEGIDRVRYTSPHPKDLRPETIAAMADEPAVCEHLHLPLQSGSNTVLAAMHRGYTAGRYLERLAAARAAVEDLAVSTDIIVGFPGETEADIAATLEVAAEAAYDNAYTFIYSPRQGTEAAAMVERRVDPATVAERFARLRVVVERSALARNQARVGRIDEVLVEGPSKRDRAVTTGRTRQNKLIHFHAAPGTAPAGSLATVEVTRGAPHFLEGLLREVVSPPRHTTRIPVAAG